MSGELRIAVKKVPGGAFSTYANDILKPGDIIEVMPPEGKFTLRHVEEHGNTIVFFAAGSGITPTIALIKTLLQTMPDVHVILFYGNKSTESIIFREELSALKNQHLGRFELHHILSREKQEAPLFNGRIDADKCRTFAKVFFQIPSVRRFFICGPEMMIFTVRDCLIEMGVEESRIAIELFTTPGDKNLSPVHLTHKVAIDPQKECHVTVRIDGDTTEFSLAYGGQSILDAATAAGVDVPFSCKGGVCCTCKAMLLEGEVDMDVVYGLEPDEIEDGFILTCQSHPRSETVLVDYDIR
jgi:ring-1,2-phenylacetyl-CoA epoxidase subunit PaaE